MAFRRRRRRPKLTWFPPIGGNFQDGETVLTTGGTTFQLTVFGAGGFNTLDLPVTFDSGQERQLGRATNDPELITLADLMSSAWRLRRMVGNIYATHAITGIGAGDPTSGQACGILFGAGAMVRATDGNGATLSNVNPLERDDYDDPWIWRRVWVLGQGQRILREGAGFASLYGFRASAGAVLDQAAAFANFPVSNTEYGDVRSGTYIDQKTNRVIGPEQRLILTFATKALPINTSYAINSFLNGYLDFRYLGALQRSSNRRNASR